MNRTSGVRIEELWLGTRFLLELPFFLRRPVQRKEADKCLRLRFEKRQPRFLNLVRDTIYSAPGSPYRKLLGWAGCEAGDLEKLVHHEGVEGALTELCRAGVYLTVDEFKGRCPIVRGSQKLTVQPHLFHNPTPSPSIGIRTSGSRSAGIPVPVDFAFIRSRSINALLGLSARGGNEWHHAVWGIPGGSAMVHLLEFSGFGIHPVKWFSHVDPATPGLHPRYHWSALTLRWAGFLGGVSLPGLQYVPVSDPLPILDWFIQVLRSGKVPHLLTYMSSALRLCRAAEEMGVEIPGAQFTVLGEPVTEIGLSTIRRTGAEAVSRYGSAECGTIGYGCLRPEAPDEVHLLHDRVALVQVKEENKDAGIPSGALFVSTLESATPFILLNVSLGDQAVMVERDCGCRLQELGWTRHLHSIRSYEKLIAGGMSFLDTDLALVMEETLPERFGGAPTHYQLLEDSDEGGLQCFRLLVHPEVGPVEPEAVVETFLTALSSGNGVERMMGMVCKDAQLLTVERTPPLTTSSGKILHFHQARQAP
ncbi:MAG: hypothetical protein JRI70_00410 [Deltaproteobacteria bacterium]|nr:hypothetical protein [Deltaproteobacteria bacterium]MBW2170446.1 hypothetical protein [Deltaproteobacteria bacterium]MBW2259747.1 hypothetical protein [Deltaproteobacteria bacterium]